MAKARKKTARPGKSKSGRPAGQKSAAAQGIKKVRVSGEDLEPRDWLSRPQKPEDEYRYGGIPLGTDPRE